MEKGRPVIFIAGDDAGAKAGVVTMGLARNGVGNWDFALGVTGLSG